MRKYGGLRSLREALLVWGAMFVTINCMSLFAIFFGYPLTVHLVVSVTLGVSLWLSVFCWIRWGRAAFPLHTEE